MVRSTPSLVSLLEIHDRSHLVSDELDLSDLSRLCGLDGLVEQDGDGHGPDPAGYGGDESGPLGGCGVFDVADVARVVAGVDHHGSGLDPVAA